MYQAQFSAYDWFTVGPPLSRGHYGHINVYVVIVKTCLK